MTTVLERHLQQQRARNAAADALAELAKEIIREYDPETATIDCASPEDFAEWCNKQAQAALSKWEEVTK